MKRSQIILFGVLLVLSALIYIPVILNKKDYEKTVKKESKTIYVPVTKVQQKAHTMQLTSYGQVSPVTELLVSFEVQGKLIQGDFRLKPGVSFRKGQLLYKIDNEEFLISIMSRKTALIGLITQSMPDFSLDFQSERKKWENFLSAITVTAPLPELPRFSSERERMFWTTRNALTEYYSILSQEKRVAKYYYNAPFSGSVTEVYAEPGAIVNPGVQIAKIAQTGELEIKVPVPLEDLDHYRNEKMARFTDPKGKTVATGKIVRISDVINQRTQSADVYYAVTPIEGHRVYNGLYLNVELDVATEKTSTILPRTAVKDNKVMILEKGKLVALEVLQIGSKPDSVYVSGLKDDQVVVLEQVGKVSDKFNYEPVFR
jgi:multidrug efflux pump subunit AcrA (membrane-fusion protein)